MRPIPDPTALSEGSVLYHSAFGFATVTALRAHEAELSWERGGDNLPRTVSTENLRRVYAWCRPGGFFHRALHDGPALRDDLQIRPFEVLERLVDDLSGPVRLSDLEDWLVGRNLLSRRAFGPWWRTVAGQLAQGGRFHLENDVLYMDPVETQANAGSPLERLRSGQLSPARRLELARELRGELDQKAFLEQLAIAWRTGSSQVRELCLAAARNEPAEDVFRALLLPGAGQLEALVHALRHGDWTPADVSTQMHHALVQRVLAGIDDGHGLDDEGRLAAALHKWGCPGLVDAMARLAAIPDGRRLLRAKFATLPQARAEQSALDLLAVASLQKDDGPAQWLGGEVLAIALVDAEAMAAKLEDSRPLLAAWFTNRFNAPSDGLPEYDDYTDDTAFTAELVGSVGPSEPVGLSDLPPATGAAVLPLGLAMARALAGVHKGGGIANPTPGTVQVLPDGSMVLGEDGDPDLSPRPEGEPRSTAGDVHAGATLLLETVFKRPWPRKVPPWRVLAYLRSVLPMLPPTAMAPLSAGLHPVAGRRPADGLAWQSMWQHAAVAEEARRFAPRDPHARWIIGADTHVGRAKMLVTQTNQDALWYGMDGSNGILVLCDGISTANAGSGDIASGIAAQIIANLWEQALPRLRTANPVDMRDFLDRALRIANQAVCEAAIRLAGGTLDGRVPMGTTAAVALIAGNYVSIAWLGDTRVYLVGPSGASLLSSDENQAGERLRSWQAGYSDRWEQGGYALISYIGHFDEFLQPSALPARHLPLTLLPGERLVLCTDGVTDYIADTQPEAELIIARLVLGETQPERGARALVNAANQGGGGDNASVIIAGLAT